MPLDSIVATLARVPLFAGLRPDQLAALAGVCERVVLRPGTVIVGMDQPGEAAFVLMGGEAVQTEGAGSEMDERVLEPGTLIGEMAMLIDVEHRATVVARGRVRALRLARESLHGLMQADPGLAEHFVAAIVRRLTAVAEELRRIDDLLANGAGAADTGHAPPDPATMDVGGMAPVRPGGASPACSPSAADAAG